MPALTHPYDSDAFWQGVATRLAPLLGDVATALGDDWIDRFEQCFSRGDFETVASAEQRVASPTFLLALYPEADRLRQSVDDLHAGASEADCVAALLDLCRDCDEWPTAVARQADGLLFLREDASFAEIRPVPPASPLAPAIRSRAEHALGRLHKHGNFESETAKRLKRWPGLNALQAGNSKGGRWAALHWPSPAEWLICARRLWAMAGVPDASTAQAQRLAAAVMDAPGWHQLCALMPGADDADWWALSGPYYTYMRDQEEARVFPGAVEAFVDFVRRAATLCAAASADPYCVVASPTIGSYLPYLRLEPVQHPDESYEDWRIREQLSDAIAMGPVPRIEASPQCLATVAPHLHANDLQGLLASFALDPEGDSYGNCIFHRANFDGLVCTGSVTRDGPYVSCGERWHDGVPLGRCALRKFQPSARSGRAYAAGWWLMKDWDEATLDLTQYTDTQIHQLSDEFGIAIFSEADVPLWPAQQAGFYASPAWEALRAWRRSHVALAEALGHDAPYLPGWQHNALQVTAP